jgi:hypothetical protein
MTDAAVAAGVEHVVFSGLENVEARTAGTKWAPHFTDKAKVADYIRSLPIRSSFVYLVLPHQLPGILCAAAGRRRHHVCHLLAAARPHAVL